MIRLRRRAPLFPYTTLFRSWEEPRDDETFKPRRPFLELPNVIGSPHNSAITAGSLAEAARRAAWKDRKSTRLNSSHRCISYAVFCLKKKKIKLRGGGESVIA